MSSMTFVDIFSEILQNIRHEIILDNIYYSVFDFINIVCGKPKKNKYATIFLQYNKLVFPKHKFMGLNQYKTPIANILELKVLTLYLGKKITETFGKKLLITHDQLTRDEIIKILSFQKIYSYDNPLFIMCRKIYNKYKLIQLKIENIIDNDRYLLIWKKEMNTKMDINKIDIDYEYYFFWTIGKNLGSALIRIKKKYPSGELKMQKLTKNPVLIINILKLKTDIISAYKLNHFNLNGDIKSLEAYIDSLDNFCTK